jgi:hypothetical protein
MARSFDLRTPPIPMKREQIDLSGRRRFDSDHARDRRVGAHFLSGVDRRIEERRIRQTDVSFSDGTINYGRAHMLRNSERLTSRRVARKWTLPELFGLVGRLLEASHLSFGHESGFYPQIASQ